MDDVVDSNTDAVFGIIFDNGFKNFIASIT
jgi:hypothetical protein